MVDKPLPTDLPSAGVEPGQIAAQPPRAAGTRGSDARDAVAELAERAQVISQEAGSKVAAAMKDIIGAAAGITGFAIESARDLVQFMVRRGQMTQDEADKLIRQAEEAHERRPASEKARPTATRLAAERAAAAKAEAARAASATAASTAHASTGGAPMAKAASKPPANGAAQGGRSAGPAARSTTNGKSAKAAKPATKSARTASASSKASARPGANKSAKGGAKKSAGSRKR